MCYLEECIEIEEQMTYQDIKQQMQVKIVSNNNDEEEEEDKINFTDLDIFFRSIGNIFITFITSATLNNLLSSKVIKTRFILSNNSLLTIFASKMDMIERCKSFNQQHGINVECSIWNLSYFNIDSGSINQNKAYNHDQMMKMIITYVCINGMHPFLGIDCDNSPHCQWSNNPQCRVRAIFERLLANKDFYKMNKYDFEYRDAWKMRGNESNLLIDVNEMMNFLFLKPSHNHCFDVDDLASFENERFTLFTFKNECDYTYKIQFDIIHCDSNLNVIDDFKISLFGKKLHFGSFCMRNGGNFFRSYWNKIKSVLLGHKFVNVKSWYVVSIKHIDTSLHGNQHNKCYYLICAEVEGTYLNCRNAEDVSGCDHMYSKLLVWKSCFFSEQQPYGHE